MVIFLSVYKFSHQNAPYFIVNSISIVHTTAQFFTEFNGKTAFILQRKASLLPADILAPRAGTTNFFCF